MFNANLEWSAPRGIALKKSNRGYGFSVIGSAPVIIQSVEEQGPAKVWSVSVPQMKLGKENAMLSHELSCLYVLCTSAFEVKNNCCSFKICF